MTFGLFFETSLAGFLAYFPGLDKGLRMYPLQYVASHSLHTYFCAHLHPIYTVSVSQKTEHFSFQHNFRKYCPVLIILSLL